MGMKISEIKYNRADVTEFVEKTDALTKAYRAAADGAEQERIYFEAQQLDKDFSTMFSLAYIRFTLNTNDAFYLAERDYYDQNLPYVEEAGTKFIDAVLENTLPAFKSKLPPLLLRNFAIRKLCFSPAIIDDLKEENALVTEYSQLISGATVNFRGEKLPVTMLNRFKEDKDRAVRRDAYEAHGEFLAANADKLDELFDKLVKVRTTMARKLGFESFTELGYCRMARNCFEPSDIEAFRRNVISTIVPAVSSHKAATAQRLGIDRLKLYDIDTNFADGEPEPKGNVEQIFEAGKRMYHEMSRSTGEFIDFMLENEAFDVLAREGKWAGGYCIMLKNYNQPFILANFNGSSADIDVLTHEAGHAFAFYKASDVVFDALSEAGAETCEIHSMAMEFFAWRWMGLFFGDDADRYKYKHLADSVKFIPYGTMVDHFQHIIYQNPDMTPAQRNAKWLELEGIYRPYMDMEGMTAFSEGRRWQYQMHIYEMPFYYIDYCLAQSVALQFLTLSQENYDEAFARYNTLLERAGTKTYVELVAEAGLMNPLVEGSLGEVMGKVTKTLDSLAPKTK